MFKCFYLDFKANYNLNDSTAKYTFKYRAHDTHPKGHRISFYSKRQKDLTMVEYFRSLRLSADTAITMQFQDSRSRCDTIFILVPKNILCLFDCYPSRLGCEEQVELHLLSKTFQSDSCSFIQINTF